MNAIDERGVLGQSLFEPAGAPVPRDSRVSVVSLEIPRIVVSLEIPVFRIFLVKKSGEFRVLSGLEKSTFTIFPEIFYEKNGVGMRNHE